MQGPTGFICTCQGQSFPNLAVIRQSFPWRHKQHNPLCLSIFLLENEHRDAWAVHSELRTVYWTKHINTAAMLIFIMEDSLYLTETYSPVAHHCYFLNKGKSNPLHTKKKKENKTTNKQKTLFFFPKLLFKQH